MGVSRHKATWTSVHPICFLQGPVHLSPHTRGHREVFIDPPPSERPLLFQARKRGAGADADRVAGTGVSPWLFPDRPDSWEEKKKNSPRHGSQRAPVPRPLSETLLSRPRLSQDARRMKIKRRWRAARKSQSRDGGRRTAERRPNYAAAHPRIGFMVGVIDGSILAVITGRDGGLVLITLQHFLLCISRSRDESTETGKQRRGGGSGEFTVGGSTESSHLHTS